MAEFYPFRALRPAEGKAEHVACLPYDVLSYEQAKELAADPESFIHVIKSEADLPSGTDLYSDAVYNTAANNLREMKQKGILQEEAEPAYYIYREISADHTQTGIVGTVSCREYEDGIIRRHELTVAEKEDDRTRHIITCHAQTGLVFLTFPYHAGIQSCLDQITASSPEADFVKHGVRHQVWAVSEPELKAKIHSCFQEIPTLYIADGHHRAASSNRAAKQMNAGDDQEAGRVMVCAFPADDLSLLGYHRFVKDLNGKTPEAFLQEAAGCFDIEETDGYLIPKKAHEIAMWMNGKGYLLTPHTDIYDESDSISRLDVSILQNNLLAPVLGIEDPRRNKRISFVGGEQAAEELKELIKTPDSAAFVLYPTSIHDLIQVADDHRIMPPKSTWFEPKLLSGLFVHEI